MMNIKKYLKISWPILYVGLKNNWLAAEDVVAMLNKHFEELNCDEQTLVDVNVNENDRSIVLQALGQQAESSEVDGIRGWQLAHLMAIAQSDITVHEKLREIELQWSRFDYPESWREFIYYMPNERTSTEDDLYESFLKFLIEEKQNLNWSDNESCIQL